MYMQKVQNISNFMVLNQSERVPFTCYFKAIVFPTVFKMRWNSKMNFKILQRILRTPFGIMSEYSVSNPKNDEKNLAKRYILSILPKIIVISLFLFIK